MFLHRLASLMRRIVHRQRAEAELDEDLRTFVDMAAADYIREGATPAEARRLALLQLGGVEPAKERVRTARHGAWLDILGRDVRFGLRQVRRYPAFSTVAIATLALGIGGVTAMFSAFDAVLIRPLPYADADRLVMIWDELPETNTGSAKHDPTPAEWIEWRRLNTVFTELAASQPADTTLSGDGEPERLPARKVTWTLWNVLGTQPLLGRVFTEDEDTNAHRVAVISHGLWQRRFGGAADVVGRTISLDDAPYKVIGVMPRHFYFMPSRDIDVWLPASFPPWMRRSFNWHDAQIVARLRPGVTLQQARQSLSQLSLQLTAKVFPGPHSVVITPMRDEIAGSTRTALILLLSASVAFLLIACVNLTNLLLARGIGRGREVAVRAALGAGRGGLIGQFLTETLVLTGLGTVAGLALALPAMRFLEQLVPDAMGAAHLTLDWRVLSLSVALALAAALTVGLAPAWRGSRFAPQEALRDGGRGIAGAHRHWLQHSLIVVETALAVVLLTCGGLLVQTFQHLRNTDLGFRSEQLLTFETHLFRYQDFDRRVAFINAEVEKMRALPGVISAGSIDLIPFTNAANATFYRFEGQSNADSANQVALIRNVSRDYLATVGARLREGRFFDLSDRKSLSPVAIVNETFANRHFPGQSPLGKRFQFGSLNDKGYWYTIVGVLKPIRESGVLEEAREAVYRVIEQTDQIGDLSAGIVVRTTADPAALVPAVRDAIGSLDKNQPLARIRTMEDIIDRQLSTSSQSTTLLGAFALLALLLASLGLYGVISHSVTQRTNDIAVRMALGATSGEILRSYGGRGLALAIGGLTFGIVLAAIASRLLNAFLYGFRPDYVPVAAVVSVVLVAVAALACLVPAHRASRIDPIIALRQE